MDKLAFATPSGPIESEATEDSITAYCFVPWAEVKMVIPLPGELP